MSDKETCKYIIDTLHRYVNSRERAYREARSRFKVGYTTNRVTAISDIRRAIESAGDKNLTGCCIMVDKLSKQIECIMPPEYSTPQQVAMANKIKGMIAFTQKHLTGLRKSIQGHQMRMAI